MHLRTTGAAVTLGVALLGAPSVAASPAGALSQAVHDSGDPCDPAVPSALGWPADTEKQQLRVRFLVDRVAAQRVQTIVEQIARTYSEIDVQVEHSVRQVPALRGAEAVDALAVARRHHVPGAADVTHLLTSQDLAYDGDATLVGYADCIGGIQGRERAVSVSEVTAKLDKARLLYRYGAGAGDAAANVASHEIGHVLGARHEHADCVAGASPPSSTYPEELTTPCSVMFAAAPTSGRFGPVERYVVRGYVAAYAG